MGVVKSVVDLVRRRAEADPDGLAYTFLEAGEREGASVTWGALERHSRAIGATIASSVAPTSRVLIVLPPCVDFGAAFLGVLFAGATAIPTYPPSNSPTDRTTARVRGIIADAGVTLVLSCQSVHARREQIESLVPELSGIPWLTIDHLDPTAAAEWVAPVFGRSSLALLQYTSGSTAAPRGVMVTHANLLHNLAHTARLAQYARDSIGVSWLPVNHDMGLINGVLQGVYSGSRTIQMAPAAFLQRPARWLQAISRYGATHSGGPNFAFDLCARRVSEQDRAGLDLSTWQLAYNGSEPVRRSSMEAFMRTFGPHGFRWTSFRPGYGLAESTLVVTSDPAGTAPVFRPAGAGGRASTSEPAASNDWVSCGVADGEMGIRIVDPVTRRRRPDGQVGEIWVTGASVAAGYWNKARESAATFRASLAGTTDGPYLRTGDLGCVADGHLFVTGRIKDVLIVRGLKHYPHDIEATAEAAHGSLRPGCCAAFAVEREGEESVALIAEVDPRFGSELDDELGADAICAIRRAVADSHQLALHAVALVPAGTLPKTTSGKLQRFLCRIGFLEGTLGTIAAWHEREQVAS
jgi:acyl-CoA synthetase (AMP-forming)/AMP-acid ligase II